MKFLADLHVHSKFSRATSPQMDVEGIAAWAKLKGIDLMASADFTHPVYLAELKDKLKEADGSLYEYNGVKFILNVEVCNIFHSKGKLKKLHTLIFAPDFKAVDKINTKLDKRGKLMADGRPIFSMPAEDLSKIVMDADKRCYLVPAHIWTPWFSIFGSKSGFDSVEECFGKEAKHIFALETGLSSDPAMNWRISGLDKYTLISNSDAHSPAKLGREVNAFDTELTYDGVRDALKNKDKKKFLYTVEFFPEEGKYHYDGHRACGVRFSPEETRAHNNICPKCNRPLTIGVMNRVDELADRPVGFTPEGAIPFKSLIPLQEIIAEARGRGVNTKGVQGEYQELVQHFGNEFHILMDLTESEMKNKIAERTYQGIMKVRSGEIDIKAGYDGEFGEISIFDKNDTALTSAKQMGLF